MDAILKRIKETRQILSDWKLSNHYMTNTNKETVEQIVARVLSFDPDAIGKARKSCAKPIEIQPPNVELYDDPQHNGQYWGDQKRRQVT